MKLTAIRTKQNELVSSTILEHVLDEIVYYTAQKGYITDVCTTGKTSAKIGLHMRSFRVDVNKIGHNGRISRFCTSPKGYKRTDVPTWDQRVEFNNIVNRILNKYKITCNVQSGCYKVRDRVTGARTERDWHNESHTWMGYSMSTPDEILTEKEARETCDSDRREAEHRARKNLQRRQTKLTLVGA